jgi:hypothetical protein
MGAVLALIGFAVKDQAPHSLLKASMVLLPFLAIGASGAIAQHQEMVTSLVKYMSSTLLRYLPSSNARVTPYEHSEGGPDHRRRSLGLVFMTQLAMICGPFVFAACFAGYDILRNRDSRVLFCSGVALTFVAATILWRSRTYRTKLLDDIYREGQSLRGTNLLG